MLFSDIVGSLGVVIILVTYGAMHAGKMKADGFWYCLLNIIGSFAVLYSLMYSWNLASFMIEVAWIVISGYGLWRYFRTK